MSKGEIFSPIVPHAVPGGYLVPCSDCFHCAECANSQTYIVLPCMGCCRRLPFY